MKLSVIGTILLLVVTIHSPSKGQNKIYQIDDTEYELPYAIPSEESIIEIIDRVSNQIISSTKYRVINELTGEAITDFRVIDTNAVVDCSEGAFNLWDYTVGVIHTGMLAAAQATNNPDLETYVINNYDFIFRHLPYFREMARIKTPGHGRYHRIINMSALDHCGSIGAALIQTQQIAPADPYRNMIDTVAAYIMSTQFRLPDGTLARERPQKQSVWTDDFYMSIPFLVRMGDLTNNTLYYDEAVKQTLQLSHYLFNPETGLFDHGKNLNAGAYDPAIYWSRANGWALLAMTTLLDILPEDTPGRDSVLEIYRTHIKSIAELQGGNGMWYNILNRFDTYPESSGTAMFVYSIAKAVNEGWIDHSYGSIALAGWNGLTVYITPKGEISNMCAGTTFGADMVYYYHRPSSFTSLHGFGPVLLAGSEILNLLRNNRFEIKKEWRAIHFKTNSND